MTYNLRWREYYRQMLGNRWEADGIMNHPSKANKGREGLYYISSGVAEEAVPSKKQKHTLDHRPGTYDPLLADA